MTSGTSGTSENYYIGYSTTSANLDGTNGWSIITDNNVGYYENSYVTANIGLSRNEKGLISPELYFTYIKKKFKLIERVFLEKRLKRIEAAFDQAVESGQNMLAEKILNNLAIEMRESAMLAKGVKHFIDRETLYKNKNKIKGGHISDTLFKDYTRVIPKKVLSRKKEVEGLFDDFVIFHYYNEEAEKQLEDKQKMSREEKERMKDPVLFGIIKETDKLYYIADWIDEYCDLTFRDIVNVIGRESISRIPKVGE